MESEEFVESLYYWKLFFFMCTNQLRVVPLFCFCHWYIIYFKNWFPSSFQGLRLNISLLIFFFILYCRLRNMRNCSAPFHVSPWPTRDYNKVNVDEEPPTFMIECTFRTWFISKESFYELYLLIKWPPMSGTYKTLNRMGREFCYVCSIDIPLPEAH